jgi:magnesium transporter
MLTLYDGRAARGRHPADLGAADLPPGVVWIDLVNPDAAEIAFIERATGLHVPSKDELSEIESSSRLRSRDGSLYLSTPLVYRAQSDLPLSTPVGFVLTPHRLITVRFEELTVFTTFIDRELAADSER